MARFVSRIFGGGGSAPTPTVDPTTTANADAAEQERLRQLGRAAMLSGGQEGILGASNVGRNSLLTR